MNHFCSQDKNALRCPGTQARLGTYAENNTIIYETQLQHNYNRVDPSKKAASIYTYNWWCS